MLKVAHFVSWWGTTMESVARRANAGELWEIRSVLVVASKDGIEAIKKANDLDIPHVVVDPKNATEILWALSRHNIHIIMNNGYFPKTPDEVVLAYSQDGKEWYNQHPWALRSDHNDFGGNAPWRWMYGSRVTAAGVIYTLSDGRNFWDHFSVESSVHCLTTVVDGGEVVWVNPLVIVNELDGYQTRNWLLVPFETVNLTEPLKILISEVQQKLLVLEHENVAQVLREIGDWWRLQRHQLYNIPLGLDPVKLNWAKTEAARLYPKW